MQGLNLNWLVQPWQQGLVLMLILIISCFLAIQRFATVLTLVKMTLVIAFLAVFLVGAAGAVWLLGGHAPATSFKTATDWGFAWNPQGYYTLALFGFICQAYLGIEVLLNMGGEITRHKVITRHLLWGTLLVIVGYFVASFGVLAVLGTGSSGNPYAIVMTVRTALGPTAGDIAAILVMCNFIVTPAVYSYAYARLLLVGGIDKRLPVRVARLNKRRVPANAIIFQTIIAIIFAAVLFIVVPSFTNVSNAATLNLIVYNVVISASTLVWAISTAFLFIDLVKLYTRDPHTFRKKLIFPMPVLLIAIVLGTTSCLVSIGGTLLYSLIPQQIGNDRWWIIVGGITFACLIIAATGSMYASSEARWQTF
jgi:amino acid transporter